MPTSIQNQLQQPAIDGADLHSWVLGEFERQVGFPAYPLDRNTESFALAMKWLLFQLETGDIYFRKHPVLQALLHQTSTSKVNALAQRHCHVCSGLLPVDRQFPIWVLPIRIEPESRQSLNSVDWAAFQLAIRSRLAADRYDTSGYRYFCIAFTFALSRLSPDRDVDNMAKALLDAFSRALGFNDKDVHHLDLLKLIDDFPEEYVYIRVRPSHVGTRSDVLFPVVNQSWAGQPALRLKDFALPSSL